MRNFNIIELSDGAFSSAWYVEKPASSIFQSLSAQLFIALRNYGSDYVQSHCHVPV